MNAVVLLLATTPMFDARTQELFDKAKNGPELTPALVQELRTNPQSAFVCPGLRADAFKDFTRRSLAGLIGQPDRIDHPTARGKYWSLGWTYYLTANHKPGKPFGGHGAQLTFRFGPGDRLHSVTCMSRQKNVEIGWTHLLVRPPEWDEQPATHRN